MEYTYCVWATCTPNPALGSDDSDQAEGSSPAPPPSSSCHHRLHGNMQFLSQIIQLMFSRQLFSHFMLQSACGHTESLADVDKWSSTWLAWRCLITYINSCSWMRLGWWQSGSHSEEHTIICEGCIQLATHCKDLVRPELWQEILQQSPCCCIGSSQQYA